MRVRKHLYTKKPHLFQVLVAEVKTCQEIEFSQAVRHCPLFRYNLCFSQ